LPGAHGRDWASLRGSELAQGGAARRAAMGARGARLEYLRRKDSDAQPVPNERTGQT